MVAGQGNVGLQANLAKLHRDLGSFFKVKAKGALVRARFSMLKEMDAPSLVWKNRARKPRVCIVYGCLMGG